MAGQRTDRGIRTAVRRQPAAAGGDTPRRGGIDYDLAHCWCGSTRRADPPIAARSAGGVGVAPGPGVFFSPDGGSPSARHCPSGDKWYRDGVPGSARRRSRRRRDRRADGSPHVAGPCTVRPAVGGGRVPVRSPGQARSWARIVVPAAPNVVPPGIVRIQIDGVMGWRVAPRHRRVSGADASQGRSDGTRCEFLRRLSKGVGGIRRAPPGWFWCASRLVRFRRQNP